VQKNESVDTGEEAMQSTVQTIMIWSYVMLDDLASRTRRRMSDERGQTAAEYLGVIVMIVAIIAVLSKTDLGTKIGNAIGSQVDKLTSGVSAAGSVAGS
jgi:pilus assembly protein Flp/PilA